MKMHIPKIFSTITIFLFLLLFQCGCTVKNDIRNDAEDYKYEYTSVQTVKPPLEDLEEIYENMDYQKVIDMYSSNIPCSHSITRFRYYVIFSSLDENTTYNLIDKDIRNTVDAMVNNYVSDLPDSVIPVILFSNYDEYKDFSVNTMGIVESDLSPFGFYKITKNTIVVRYVNWKGSISHEFTHSLIQHDFPDIPSWFNEGLAALHEKYILKDSSMIGDFNWRIVSLRRALRENTYTGLRKLMETNDEELYEGRTSFYYAQSRYLLMYLQQKNRLENYYKLFRDTYDDDPTGITQLEKVTHKSLKKIDKELVDYIHTFDDFQW